MRLHKASSARSSATVLLLAGFMLLALPVLLGVALARPNVASPHFATVSADSRSAAWLLNGPPPEAEESVESAKEALGSWHRYPWYDASRDDLESVIPPDVRKESELPDLNLTAIRWIAWLLLAVILIYLIFYLLRAFWDREALSTPGFRRRKSTKVDHVEALPHLADRNQDDLLGAARRSYEAGDYREAIIYLFSHELVELDQLNLIRLALGKTNRQYLRELRGRPTLRGLVEQVMWAFEKVFFGDHVLTREEFEACYNRLAEFDHLKQEVVATPQPALQPAPVTILGEAVQ